MTYNAPPTYSGGNYEYTQAAEPPLDQPWYGIGFIPAFTRFFKKYAVFSGRASRSEFWFSYLGLFIINMILSIFSRVHGIGGFFNVLNVLWSLAILVPTIAIQVRRLHDSNRSGALAFIWYGLYLLATIIVAASFGALIFAIATGGTGYTANRFAAGLGAGAVGGLLLTVLAFLAGGIVWLVFMVANSNPAGARFDKPGAYYAQPQPAYPAAGSSPYPQTTQPGQYPQYPQYPQQGYGQPVGQAAYPAQPTPQNPYTAPVTAPGGQSESWSQAPTAAQPWQPPAAAPLPVQPAPAAPVADPAQPFNPAQPLDPAQPGATGSGEGPASSAGDSAPLSTPFDQQ